MQNASAPVKAAFWFTVCSIINKCIQLITVPIFTRILTTTEYGQYSIFVSWQSILLIIATLNIYISPLHSLYICMLQFFVLFFFINIFYFIVEFKHKK